MAGRFYTSGSCQLSTPIARAQPSALRYNQERMS
jgi:hypothetical protein